MERSEVTLDDLRELRHRVFRQQLEPADWPLIGAMVSKQIARAEERQARMIAKIAAAKEDARGAALDADNVIQAGESGSSTSPDANATGSSEPTMPDSEAEQSDSKESKGHGRNGASAYRRATHYFHALAVGVIGAVCEVCGLGKMYRYREKVIIRIVGQPLFDAERHHYEQARCRECGRIVRAGGPAHVHEGIGSEYVRHDWSACAMLMVMHDFGGAPFKRLESLHAGWGIPMPDANPWQVVNAADDLLLPLYKALERYAIQKATNFRIDDTGSRVIAARKLIDEEIAALQRLGESTKGVRTGINATGVYWETPSGPVILFYTGRHHAGEIVDQLLRLVQLPDRGRGRGRRSLHVPHRHGARKRRRTRSLFDRVSSPPRGHRPESRRVLALDVPKACGGEGRTASRCPRTTVKGLVRPSDRPTRELRDLAPAVRESAARRVATPDQDLQLASEQR